MALTGAVSALRTFFPSDTLIKPLLVKNSSSSFVNPPSGPTTNNILSHLLLFWSTFLIFFVFLFKEHNNFKSYSSLLKSFKFLIDVTLGT